jgi:hypothetical protein
MQLIENKGNNFYAKFVTEFWRFDLEGNFQCGIRIGNRDELQIGSGREACEVSV